MPLKALELLIAASRFRVEDLKIEDVDSCRLEDGSWEVKFSSDILLSVEKRMPRRVKLCLDGHGATEVEALDNLIEKTEVK